MFGSTQVIKEESKNYLESLFLGFLEHSEVAHLGFLIYKIFKLKINSEKKLHFSNIEKITTNDENIHEKKHNKMKHKEIKSNI